MPYSGPRKQSQYRFWTIGKKKARFWLVNGQGPLGFRGPFSSENWAELDRRPGERPISTDDLCAQLRRLLMKKKSNE